MKKELKSGILSADKSADCRPTVGGVNVIAVYVLWMSIYVLANKMYTSYGGNKFTMAIFKFL